MINRAQIRAQAAALLRARVVAALAPRQELLPPTAEALAALAPRVAALEAQASASQRAARALERDLAALNAPFTAEMSIDQAWRRHRGAPAVFARHHLPACDGCAVRFDETLAEAAAAYDLDLDALLEALNGLLRAGPPRPTPTP